MVDAVGSHTLANACAQTRYGGVVAACGLAQGMDLPGDGGALHPARRHAGRHRQRDGADRRAASEAWERLATRPRSGQARRDHRGDPARARRSAQAAGLMAGKVRGRIVVKIDVPITRETHMTTYADFHRRSIDDRDGFWAEQAQADRLAPAVRAGAATTASPPFASWFVGGATNLCHNAVDRHLATRADQHGADLGLDRDRRRSSVYTFRELHAEVQRMAAMLQALGVEQGRPRADLHADDSRGGVRDAGLRAHRRDPLGGVRRLRRGSLAAASTTRSRR